MSLKNFHVFFITVSVLLCLFVAGWAGAVYRVEGGGGMLALAAGSLVSAVGLVVYGVWFLRKMRGMES